MPDRVVFWDIDGTLLEGSLEGGFVRYLRKHDHINLPKIIWRFARQILRVPLPSGYQFKVAYLRKQSITDVDRWMDSYWSDRVIGRLYPDIRRTVDQLCQQGFKQVLLSGTLFPLARRLGDYLGIGEIIAAEPEIAGDKFSGGLRRPHPAGPRKTKYAREWLELHGLGFSDAVALGNHYSDRDLMSRVLVPIAVNPSDRLRAYATKTGWPVIERPAEVQRLTEAIVNRLQS